MSGGQICRCPESKKPLLERAWRVTQWRCNHSAFSGYHRTPSDYSAIICEVPGCTGGWRTKAAYADTLAMRGPLKKETK
jgi:hypothetical protein